MREEIIRGIEEPDVQLEGSWRDVPMRFDGGVWSVELALTEVGWFQSKAYVVDAEGRQHWPDGDNIGLGASQFLPHGQYHLLRFPADVWPYENST